MLEHRPTIRRHALEALESVVKLSAGQCYGCAWEQIIKPLALPLVGFSRNVPRQAKDTRDRNTLSKRWVTAAEIEEPEAPEPTTAAEEWLRTSEAYESVVRVWLRFLEDADAAVGCRLRFPTAIKTPFAA